MPASILLRQDVRLRKLVVGKIGVNPVQQDVQLVQVPQHLVPVLPRLKDRHVRKEFLQIGQDLFLFLRVHRDGDPVGMMLRQAVLGALKIMPQVWGFETVTFPVLNLLKCVEHFFLI